MSKKWTRPDDLFLMNNADKSDDKLGEELGRTPGAIRGRRRRLGLFRAPEKIKDIDIVLSDFFL